MKPKITEEQIIDETVRFFSRWSPSDWTKWPDAPGPVEAKALRKLVMRFKRQQKKPGKK